MHANNETGVLQPIAQIAEALRGAGQKIYFHCDGVQAVGKVPVDVEALSVDLYSVSAHKISAPKGIGGLYVRKGTPLRGIQFGGRHERERRAGTENVPGAIAFARAVELCDRNSITHFVNLRDQFESEMLALGEIEINGGAAPRLPNTSNLLFRGVSGEGLLIALDMKGMAVSTGSACSSGSVEPSPVLLAMGRSRDEARSSVRFSFGRDNSRAEVQALIDAVRECVTRLRKTSRVERPVYA